MKSMQTIISFAQQFASERDCFDYLEELRWGGEPVCPHCGRTDVYSCRSRHVYKCSNTSCKKQFTVRVNTLMEGSRLPLRKWFLAAYWLTVHRRGLSSVKAARRLDITQKSAWNMLRHIRQALGEPETASAGRLQPLIVDMTFDELMLKIIEAQRVRLPRE